MLLPPTTAIPFLAGSIPTWWRANSETISSYINQSRQQMALVAGESRVPASSGSVDRATTAVDVGSAEGIRVIGAGQRDLPLTTVRGGDEIFRVPGQTPQGTRFDWKWIAIGVGVLGFTGVIGYFALRKKGRKGLLKSGR